MSLLNLTITNTMSTAKSQWLLYAILSGACAALNGVFARLTTTHLTTSIATKTAQLIGQDEPSYYIEILVRSVSSAPNTKVRKSIDHRRDRLSSS